MEKLLFGTGGTPHSAKTASTVDGIRRIAKLGLGCMEIEFVQGVRMGEAAARLVVQVAKEEGVRLTAHAPYFVNFNAHELEKVRASQKRLLQTARIGAICGVESIAVHIAFYLGDPPEKAYETVKKYLSEVLERLKREDNKIWIRPELMGKMTQFGTLEELLKLSTEFERVAPVIDFAHWHARTAKFNSYPEFASILEQIKGRLGKDAINNMHIHFSGIAFGKKGETKHLNLKESDFQYKELLRALKDYDAKGFVICESPNLEEDAVFLQEIYKGL